MNIIVAIVILLLHSAAVHSATSVDWKPIGPQPTVIDGAGGTRYLYEGSYALLISESRYSGVSTGGWRALEETGAELDLVAAALIQQGFQVTRISDATSAELSAAFLQFGARYGRNPNNRLLFFFSGHGYTDQGNSMGYIVPTDARDPRLDPENFFSKAIAIENIELWSKSLLSRHVLYVFDSCFSGTIFLSKGEPTRPETRGHTIGARYNYLTGNAAAPVRQFIAAGGPKETLPAKSIFIPLFIKAIQGSASQQNDGYITGKEMGTWLEQMLPQYNKNQNPHSGIIRVPELSFGDIVFQPSKATLQTVNLPRQPLKVAIPDPMPKEISKVTFAADAFFDFNSSRLKPEGAAKLDDLVAKVREIQLEVIMAIGHSDSVSENIPNISMRRAEGVKSYLVSKGIEPNRIYTEGKEMRQPVASNETAEGRAKNRRVEIEVVGTRVR